jgi:hypothetical protein
MLLKKLANNEPYCTLINLNLFNSFNNYENFKNAPAIANPNINPKIAAVTPTAAPAVVVELTVSAVAAAVSNASTDTCFLGVIGIFL